MKYIFLFVVLFTTNLYASGGVVGYPDSNATLSTRWQWAIGSQWAIGKANAPEFKNGCWIVYSIQRMMGIDDWIGHYGDERSGVTLMEILTGKRPARFETTVGEDAKRILDDMDRPEDKENGERVLKEIAVLIQFQPSSKSISRVKLSSMEMHYPTKSLPILWLGNAQNQQSIELLQTFYRTNDSNKRKEELISAIALHQNPDLVIPFLTGVVDAGESMELQKSAVFWLGQTQEPRALKFLMNLVNTSSAKELWKSAVFSISQMSFPEARQALMQIATQKQNREARLEAIFWIGQQGFENGPKTLEEIIFNDSDQEAQLKAVFSASQLKKQLGIPILTRVATVHSQSKIRGEAIFWIGQTGGKAEGVMLEKIAQKDPNSSLQKKAIFSISQMEKDISIPGLERIAKTHPDSTMRKEAIFWLGQMKDSRAKQALLQILKQ